MNKRIAMLAMPSADVCYIMDPLDGSGSPNLQRKTSVEQLTADWGTILNPHNPKLKPIPKFKAWLEHPAKKRYLALDVVVDKVPPQDTFNLWTGWPHTQLSGRCNLLIDHIHENVCGGDQDVINYVTRWLAFGVQKPMEPVRTAFVMLGVPGCGKGTLAQAFMTLFGKAHCASLARKNELVGGFNYHLMGKLVIFADEAFFAEDKAAAQELKTMITESERYYEEKFRPKIPMQQRANIMMATNDIHAVHVEAGDRRYCVVEVADTHALKPDYFDAIRAQLADDNGYSAFWHYLRNTDLTSFDPRELPHTAAIRNQKLMSMPSVQKWWYENLNADTPCPGGIPEGQDWDASIVQAIPQAYQSYLMWAKHRNVKYVSSDRSFGIELSKIRPTIGGRQKPLSGGVRVNGWKVPGRETCKTHFCKFMGCEFLWDT